MTGDPEFEAELAAEERRVAEQLTAGRPVPRLTFRAAMRNRMAALDPGYGPRPEHLWVAVAGCLIAGLLLLAVGGLLSVGVT